MARYLLGDRAAAWLKAQLKDANAVQIADVAPTRKQRVAGVGSGSPAFHFGMSIEDVTPTAPATEVTQVKVTMKGGIVQVGGYTYFVDDMEAGDELTVNIGTEQSPTTAFVCVEIDLTDGSTEFTQYASTSALKAEQDDMEKYVWPLYKLVNGVRKMDYRPVPNAGCWEITPTSGSSGTSS